MIVNFNLNNLKLFELFSNSSHLFFNVNSINNIDLEKLYNFSSF